MGRRNVRFANAVIKRRCRRGVPKEPIGSHRSQNTSLSDLMTCVHQQDMWGQGTTSDGLSWRGRGCLMVQIGYL